MRPARFLAPNPQSRPRRGRLKADALIRDRIWHSASGTVLLRARGDAARRHAAANGAWVEDSGGARCWCDAGAGAAVVERR